MTSAELGGDLVLVVDQECVRVPGEVDCQRLVRMGVTVFEPVPQLYEEAQVRPYRIGSLRPALLQTRFRE